MAQREGGSAQPSGWAVGFAAFAGALMMIAGFFHAVAGLSAVFNSGIYAVTPRYVFAFDVTAWGWIHLLLGVIVVVAGYGIFRGAVWARTIGVVIAVISAVANFVFLPFYPLWAIVIIAVDIAIIWALTAHGTDIAR